MRVGLRLFGGNRFSFDYRRMDAGMSTKSEAHEHRCSEIRINARADDNFSTDMT